MAAVVALVRFGSELALLAGAVVVGAHVWAGPAGWVVGGFLALAVASVWGRWLAPKARRRLVDPGRLVLEATLFVGTGALLATTGSVAWGVALAVVGVLAAVAIRRYPPKIAEP